MKSINTSAVGSQKKYGTAAALRMLSGIVVTAVMIFQSPSKVHLAEAQLVEGTSPPAGMPERLRNGWNMMQLGCRLAFDPDGIWHEAVPMTCTWNMALFSGLNALQSNMVNTAANWADCLAASGNAETCNATTTRDSIQCGYCDFEQAIPDLNPEYIEQFGPGSCLPLSVVTFSCALQEGISLWPMMQEPYRDAIPRPIDQAACLEHSADEETCLQTSDTHGNPCGFCAITSNLDYMINPTNTVCFQKRLLEEEHWCEHLNSNWRTIPPSSGSTTSPGTVVPTATENTSGSESLLQHASTIAVLALASLAAAAYGVVVVG